MSEFDWLAALVVGFALAWVIQALRLKVLAGVAPEEHEKLVSEKEEIAAENARLNERSANLEAAAGEQKKELEGLREMNTELKVKLAASEERIDSHELRLKEQKEELESIQKKLTAEFENLATKVLDENSKKFVVKNQENLDKLLAPLGEKLVSFRERVEKTHEQGIRDRAALAEQLKGLNALNQQMSEEARNLTQALKGQTKTQGNWGELILETVLEKSGLVVGQEYRVQASMTTETGKRYQPDVLVNLPEGKHLVVDAKVSLVAYERCVNAESDSVRDAALKEHVNSLKAHVTELSKKQYDALYEIDSPDFVLMFVPIEAAFSVAMQAEDALFDHAFRQNVVIVTPSTLLATLRTVANIWRQEKQTRNVLEIARRSGALYDKFVGFYDDMQAIGSRIGQSQKAYDAAMNKLSEGKGNLVKSVEDIKKLGARAKKALPEEVVNEALIEE